MSDILLSLKDVKRHFSVRRGVLDAPATLRAVDGVSLDVARGQTVGLVGESGCGKSTVARVVMRLMPPTAGDVFFQGVSLFSECDSSNSLEKDYPRMAQMVFQDPFSSLNPRRTVGAAIAESLVALKIGDTASRKARVAELLERVGLAPEHATRYPHEFSGGQRQRIAIARALAPSPKLLVCDEPVSALDVSIQAQVLNLLADLQTDFGLTYLFISHDLAVVSHVSDMVAVMYLGRLMELAPGAELLSNPKHPYSRALVSAAPVPDPARRTDTPPLAGDVPSPIDPPPGCPFHPRCPDAMTMCAEQEPGWTDVGPARSVRCHLYGS